MLNELIEKLNKYCSENNIYDIDDMSDEIWDELEQAKFQHVATVDHDEHRWYVLAENVYSVLIGGEKHYIGVWEVDTLKSECMSVEDCMCEIEFYEMEQFTTVSYRRKEKKA